jgi:hypothetical protein
VGTAWAATRFLGQAVDFYNPNLRTPYSLRWNFTIQRQLARDTEPA